MANVPAVLATVNITAKDINGNNIAKQFSSVYGLNFDYSKGTIEVIDITGTFYFSLTKLTTLTYTITTGLGGQHTVVTS